MRRTMNIGNRNTYNVILAKPALESFIPGASIQFKNVPLKADLYNWIPAFAGMTAEELNVGWAKRSVPIRNDS